MRTQFFCDKHLLFALTLSHFTTQNTSMRRWAVHGERGAILPLHATSKCTLLFLALLICSC